jgi:hypothetical protein
MTGADDLGPREIAAGQDWLIPLTVGGGHMPRVTLNGVVKGISLRSDEPPGHDEEIHLTLDTPGGTGPPSADNNYKIRLSETAPTVTRNLVGLAVLSLQQAVKLQIEAVDYEVIRLDGGHQAVRLIRPYIVTIPAG